MFQLVLFFRAILRKKLKNKLIKIIQIDFKKIKLFSEKLK